MSDETVITLRELRRRLGDWCLGPAGPEDKGVQGSPATSPTSWPFEAAALWSHAQGLERQVGELRAYANRLETWLVELRLRVDSLGATVNPRKWREPEPQQRSRDIKG